MLTETDCTTILQNLLKRKDVHFKKFELRPISENLEGFMGEHHKLLITHEIDNQVKTEQLFIKTAPTKNPAQLEMAQGFGVYKKEIFFYEVLLPVFAKSGFDTSFAATSYYSITDKAIVMEDMTLKQFSLTERQEHFSLEHLKCALDSMAIFHAAGFAFDQLKTKQTGRKFRLGEIYNEQMKENLFVQQIDPTGYAMKTWNGNTKTILKLVSLVDKDRFPEFSDLYRNYKFGKVMVDDSGISKTCVHGDLWSNNLMFRYRNMLPVQCCILDFQLLRYFYPSLDVLYMIFINTNAEFRKEHLDRLYRYYFDKLGDGLRKYGCTIDQIHPWEDFLQSIKLVKPDALNQVLMDKCITCLPKDKISNIVKEDGGDSLNELMFDNSVMAGNAFKIDVNYRKGTLECIADFYEALIDLVS